MNLIKIFTDIFTDNKTDLEDDIDERHSLNLPDYDGRIIGWGFVCFIVVYSLLKYFKIF